MVCEVQCGERVKSVNVPVLVIRRKFYTTV